MIRHLFTYIAILLLGFMPDVLVAQGNVPAVENLRMERNGDYLTLQMDLLLGQLDIDANRALLLTPCLVGKENERSLPAIGLYGRRRYYYYQRTNGDAMLSGTDETVLRSRQKPEVQPYEAIIAYEPWMNGATLMLKCEEYGCCNEVLAEGSQSLHRFVAEPPAPYMPLLIHVQPAAEKVKERALSGSAYIEFVVNRSDIRPDYRNNRAELAKITATIDSVRNDTDIRITTLSIKGHASPEGSYAANERIAKERTEALKQYVSRLYHFADGFIFTTHEPEDWEGLRRYVAHATDLPHRTEILALIDDTSLQPDAKEARIRNRYPQAYRTLRADCYPALRHSDYRVEYIIRNFTDVEEIKRILESAPQKLSLNEFYLVAETLEPGSDAFNHVFETAVRIYPDDAIANLNAATTALRRLDLPLAKRYLDKAGNSPQAIYTRGVLAYLNEEVAEAEGLFKQAEQGGAVEATRALKEIAKRKNE